MKRIGSIFSLLGLMLCLNQILPAQSWKIDPERSGLRFEIKNLGVTVEGTLPSPSGVIEFDAANLAVAKFTIKIGVDGIDTGIKKRDSHLKKEEFFDMENWPSIRFSATKVEKQPVGYLMTGTLSIKDVSKTVTFPFSFAEKDNYGLFDGKITINREDYGVGDGMLPTGTDVKVTIVVVAKKS